mgnify:CR=1 FL=1
MLKVRVIPCLDLKGGPPALEGVRDVLEEDEPEHEVLVLGGLDVAAKSVAGIEECLGERQFAAAVGRGFGG